MFPQKKVKSDAKNGEDEGEDEEEFEEEEEDDMDDDDMSSNSSDSQNGGAEKCPADLDAKIFDKVWLPSGLIACINAHRIKRS